MRIDDIKKAEQIAWRSNELIDEIEQITIMVGNLTRRCMDAMNELLELA